MMMMVMMMMMMVKIIMMMKIGTVHDDEDVFLTCVPSNRP